MTSKLDYLKKYLAKPGAEGAQASGRAYDLGSVAKAPKDKKKSRKGAIPDNSTLRIRDLSEVLPKARDDRRARGPLAGLQVEEDVEYVDEQAVEAAAKASAEEVSGVKWNIKQHRKVAPVRPNVRVKREDPDDGDLSPPRGRPQEVKREAAGSESDLSPPRQGGGATASKAKKPPVVKKEEVSDDDMSPPRAPAGGARAVKPKVRHDSDSDMSPPRAPAAAAANRRQRHDSDADLSPPRKAAKTEVKRERHDSDADLSPPRKSGAGAAAGKAKVRHDSDSDLSPPRAAAAPAAKRAQRHDSDSDLSPPRAAAKKEKADDEEMKMSSGLRAGLVAGEALKAEAKDIRAKRQAALAAAPDEETGKGATTVYRSRETGAHTTREEFAKQATKKKKKKLSDYPDQELEWGGGLKQSQNEEEQREELSRIAAQPFARFEVDEKHMDELKAKQDWNDPMRKHEDSQEFLSAGAASAAGAAEKAPGPPKPKCPHAPWINRFNVKPGYRWDGKIRGHNYEQRWLENKNHQEFRKREAWQMSEMNS